MGIFFSLGFLVVAMMSKNETVKKSALYLILFTAIMTIPAYLTGDGAEEVVMDMPGVTSKAIHAHEHFAYKFVWLFWGTSLLAVYGLFLTTKKKKYPQWLMPLIFILSLGSIAAGAWTNKLGGKISHPELREGGVINAGDADEKETDRD